MLFRQGEATREIARRTVEAVLQAGTAERPAVEGPLQRMKAAMQSTPELSTTSPSKTADLRPAVLDAATELARALLQLWAERRQQAPEQQAQLRVRMARAAALRPCANLCVVERGAEGGMLCVRKLPGCR